MLNKFDYLFQVHKERSLIRDGIGALSDQSILRRISETPKKLKDRFFQLYKYLRRMEVTLNGDNEVIGSID